MNFNAGELDSLADDVDVDDEDVVEAADAADAAVPIVVAVKFMATIYMSNHAKTHREKHATLFT